MVVLLTFQMEVEFLSFDILIYGSGVPFPRDKVDFST